MRAPLAASLIAIILLAACRRDESAAPVPEADRIACALTAGAAFSRDCAIERVAGGLVLRAPDGSFRRFTLTHDARRLMPADGAEAARATPAPAGEIELAIGGARYRLPAAVAPAR